jgi:hypothetical protein
MQVGDLLVRSHVLDGQPHLIRHLLQKLRVSLGILSRLGAGRPQRNEHVQIGKRAGGVVHCQVMDLGFFVGVHHDSEPGDLYVLR